MYKQDQKRNSTFIPAPVAQRKGIVLEDNRPQSIAQRKQADALAGRNRQPVQRQAIKSFGNGMDGDSKKEVEMQELFSKAYARFNSAILSSCYLAQGDNNIVQVTGVTRDTLPDMGATYIDIAGEKKSAEDEDSYRELWKMEHDEKIHKDAKVCISIIVNMTDNKSIVKLYGTLLHEWYAHASKWEGLVKSIRKGDSMPPDVQGQVKTKDYEGRAREEHKEYANNSKEDVEDMIGSLKLEEDEGLNDTQRKKLKTNLYKELTENDRDTYDKDTGEVLTKKTGKILGSAAKGRALDSKKEPVKKKMKEEKDESDD